MSTNKRNATLQPSTSSIQDDVSRIAAEVDSTFKGRKVLITGGAGFLGSWLCEVALKSGADVTCIDNMSTGRMENIKHLLPKTSRSLRFLNANAEDVKLKDDYDYILHFASRASPEEYQQHPIETLKANSLGTLNMLDHAVKSKAIMVYASTSEVYGDAQVVPTPETYWGNVNPIGVRSCYDEGKRFGEALCTAYSKEYGLDVRLARIFNSIPAGESVIFLNGDELHVERIEAAEGRISARLRNGYAIHTPAFDPADGRVKIYPISAVHRHTYVGDVCTIDTTYGRRVRVTGDHSVFTRSPTGMPLPIFARLLKKGDYVAIPKRIVVPEKDFKGFRITEALDLSPREVWKLRVSSPTLHEVIHQRRSEILSFMKESGHFKKSSPIHAFLGAFSRYKSSDYLPLAIMRGLGISIPDDAKVSTYWGGKQHPMPNQIRMDSDLLWLTGFYVAEGCSFFKRGKSYGVGFASDDRLVKRAAKILAGKFNMHIVYQPRRNGKPPTIKVNSWIVFHIFGRVLRLFEGRIPSWVFQLPLQRLAYFLEGYKDGDGTHSGKSVGARLDFNTSRKRLAQDISLLLLRFGVVAMVRRYTTTFKQKYGERRFPFYRISVQGLSTYDILDWHKNVSQGITARQTNDVVWARVKRIRRQSYSGAVYDFSVPGAENFVAGFGVFCHNTYGPRIRADGAYARALPRFVNQALRNEPITIYGDGAQTRSFCYISDTINGILKLVAAENLKGEVVNIGNPHEVTINELAETIMKLTGTKSRMTHMAPQPDDPRRRKPDISKAIKLLKWQPRVELQEGLKKTIEWFKLKS